MLLPQDIRQKRILFSPLNWGMGHVSRSIGLIDQLLQQENTLIIACDSKQREVYEAYFDQVEFVLHEGYPFEFKGNGKFGSDIASGIMKLRKRLLEEKDVVEEYVRSNNIDLVVSDHRYGFISQTVPSVFITHQLNLPLKWYQFPAAILHQKYISSFNEVWVMDTPDNTFAGQLSKSGQKTVNYIGPYSRFSRYQERPVKDVEMVLVVSGPDIYAQQLINQVVNSAPEEGLIVVCDSSLKVPEGIEVVRGDWKEKDEILLRAKKILSRSGYSTIMDVNELGIEGEYLPTPGQSEQEYLAQLHSRINR